MKKTKSLFYQLHEANEKLKDSEENYKHYVDKCFALEDKLKAKDEEIKYLQSCYDSLFKKPTN